MFETRSMGRFEIEMKVFATIQLAAKDIDGSVLAIQLDDGHGNIYLVDDTLKGDQLLPYIGAKVEVLGSVRKEDSIKIIHVKDYTVRR